MASDTARWPWHIDAATAVAEFGSLPATITTQRIAPGTIQWTGHNIVAADQVILQDTDAHEIWRSGSATGADFEDDYKFPDTVVWKGIVLVQMQHGILNIYFR